MTQRGHFDVKNSDKSLTIDYEPVRATINYGEQVQERVGPRVEMRNTSLSFIPKGHH